MEGKQTVVEGPRGDDSIVAKVTNEKSGTNVAQIADGIYRISTPVPAIPGSPSGFTFNSFLIVDDEPLLYHTGFRRMFPLVKEAVESVMPASDLRWISFGHFEPDECGSLNEWLEAAPKAQAICSPVGATVCISDYAIREPKAFVEGERYSLGKHSLRFFSTPHLPHGWDAQSAYEETTGTLLAGDLFTQQGGKPPAVSEDIDWVCDHLLDMSDYFVHTPTKTRRLLEKLGATEPRLLACMHGSALRVDGKAALSRLADIRAALDDAIAK